MCVRYMKQNMLEMSYNIRLIFKSEDKYDVQNCNE